MEDNTSSLHAAILAAGPGTRFGGTKQLVRLRGEPVIHELAANAAFVAGQSVTVVLGAHAGEIAPALRQRAVSIALNRGWEEGVASSIRTAVHSAPPGSDALMLLLADQVAVTADDLKRLHASWKRHPILIAAALYQGAPGLPAIFPRWAFSDLLALRGERDARSVLRRNIDRVVRVPMSNAGIDLDTPEDLLQVEAAQAASGADRP
jgi:CTP:molybdopterin cytidylyltransferase MocA